MSVLLMGKVWALDLPAMDKFVLLAIADSANDDNEAWPSMNRIAEKCSLERRSVRRVLSRLTERGLIVAEQRLRGNGSMSSNMYRVVIPDVQKTLGGGDPESPGVVTLSQGGGDPESPGVVTLSPPQIHKVYPSVESISPPAIAAAPVDESKSTAKRNHAWLTRWWCYAFAVLTSEQYAYTKKSAGLIRDLLRALPVEEVVTRVCVYLAMAPEQRFPRGSPTLEGLAAMVNQLAGRCTTEIEDRCWKLGLLPDSAEIKITDHKPWETTGDHPQLPLH